MYQYLNDINTICGKYKKKIWTGMLLLFFVQFNKVLPSYFVGLIANEVTIHGYTNYCLYLALIIGAIWALASYLRLVLKSYLSQTIASAVHDARIQGIKNVVTSSYGGSSSEQLSKLTSGTDNFRFYLSILWNDYFSFIATLIVSVVILAGIDLKAILVLAFNLLSFLLLLKYTSYKIRHLLKQRKALRARLQEHAGELALNRLTIQTFGQTGIDSSAQASTNISGELMMVEKEITRRSTKQWFFFNLICAATMSLGILCFIDDSLKSPGVLIWAFGCFYATIITCVGMLNNWDDLVRLSEDIHDSATLLKQKNHTSLSAAGNTGIDKITIKDLSFGYPGQELIFNNFNLTLSKRKWTGIVGDSGSGKSTLIKIILGVIKPLKGEIMLDDVPLIDLAALITGNELTVALQECEIFSGSLLENITLGRELPQSQIKLIIETAQLESVRDRCGLKTPIGEKGAFLSGGERQRLSIARAIASKPDFLILDEATSQLDEPTETKILTAIKTNFPDTGVMMVTHHDRPIRFCDEIIRINSTTTA